MYLLLVPTLVVAGWGFYRRIRLWRAGGPALRFDRLGERVDLFLRSVAAQGRTNRNRFVAFFHTGLYAGFIVLTLATIVVLIHEDSKYLGLPLQIMRGEFYLVFQSLIVDLFGLWVVVGVALAAARRLMVKPRHLVYTDEAARLLLSIFVISVTGFLLEGWRIAVTDDPWGAWSPVGWWCAQVSQSLMGDQAMRGAHRFTWWFHLVVVFGFIAWAPYTKLAHVVTSPLNIFTANLDGYGASLRPVDFESATTLGTNSLTQYTWKDRLDLDACTECGRCTAACPANTVGKELSPRDLILELRDLMHQNEQQMLAAAPAQTGGSAAAPAVPLLRAGTAMASLTMFQCTSCAACMEACPVYIEHLPKIVDARRYLVMEQAEMPEGMAKAITSLESRQHPFAGTQYNRLDWAKGLDVAVLGEMADPKDAEVVFWVGCGGALVERNQATVRATAQLLQRAGVRFAVLGREETCTGDPARRIGNEFLFELLAKGNVETLGRYEVKKIVTSCPHCFNTFKNEYPRLGGHYEVFHHSQFLEALVAEGKLPRGRRSGQVMTFHDPCYLGRHNGEFDAPRAVLGAAVEHPREMARSRASSFCCGGGGGMAFVDEPPHQRVNQERAQEALDTGADVVAVACPFCTTMLEDGVKARQGARRVRVADIAELLLEAVEAEPPRA